MCNKFYQSALASGSLSSDPKKFPRKSIIEGRDPGRGRGDWKGRKSARGGRWEERKGIVHRARPARVILPLPQSSRASPYKPYNTVITARLQEGYKISPPRRERPWQDEFCGLGLGLICGLESCWRVNGSEFKSFRYLDDQVSWLFFSYECYLFFQDAVGNNICTVGKWTESVDATHVNTQYNYILFVRVWGLGVGNVSYC